MPLPEGYLPRKGDELLIRAKVAYDCQPNERDVHIKIIGAEHKTALLSFEDVHAIHQRSWQEGERVTSIEFNGPGTILATSEDMVWILVETGEDKGARLTLEANELEPYVKPPKADLGTDGPMAIMQILPPAPGSQ